MISFPTDWQTTRIGEAFSIKQGKSLSRAKQTGTNQRPFLRTANVFWGNLKLDVLDKMSFTDTECSALALELGDLLVCEGGDIGRTAVWRGEMPDCLYQNHLHRLRRVHDNVLPLFVMYWMQAGMTLLNVYEGAGNKTTIPNLSRSRLSEFEIPLPPLPEQKKIAAVLLKVHRAIETQDKIIQSLRDLKKSTMQHLFTHGLRGEKTKMTEIGEIPESWDVVKLGELGDIVTGTTPPTKRREYYEGGGYQFIAPADLGSAMRIHTSEKEITEEGMSVSRVLPKGTVCFVCIGSSIGKVGITVAERSATNQQINAIVSNDDYDPFFIAYLLLHRSAYVAGHASPSPVPIMSKGKFSEIQIPVTRDKTVQEQIGNCLLGIEDKQEVHRSEKASLQDLFKTTLNKLMTGDIRVADLDIDVKEVEV